MFTTECLLKSSTILNYFSYIQGIKEFQPKVFEWDLFKIMHVKSDLILVSIDLKNDMVDF